MLTNNPWLETQLWGQAGFLHGPWDKRAILPGTGTAAAGRPAAFDVQTFVTQMFPEFSGGGRVEEDEIAERLSQWLGRPPLPAEVRATLDYVRGRGQ
ncbi:MAG: hypothetical protein NTZ05_12600 [Chloroflexi bacterium]|nr:hypothetical protein [Chloroflexota bacterium]